VSRSGSGATPRTAEYIRWARRAPRGGAAPPQAHRRRRLSTLRHPPAAPLAALAALAVALAGPAASAGAQGTVIPPITELTQLRPMVDSSGYRATVVVYDLQRNKYQAVHGERAARRLVPASTFKIVNALTAVDLGVVAGPAAVIPWDSVERDRPEWNRDLDLREAFRVSAVPHFQHLARQIGPARMQRALDRAGYGNRNIGSVIDRFWLDGPLRISPLEQVQMLTRLYRGELPFSPRAITTVRDIMVVEQTPAYTVRAKTGWTNVTPDEVGWWVGWVERGPDVYVFATSLESPNPTDAFGPARERITRRVLAALGAVDPPPTASPPPRVSRPAPATPPAPPARP